MEGVRERGEEKKKEKQWPTLLQTRYIKEKLKN